ncbi:methionine aminotransferase [Telluribacter humicola]|uniref:methionine aminotransferase n=1 Tax=Telluribacter humicola TaxID=1720261 RepID=UPI001A95669F|nr:methionine aminotransferase [Telluribacter humicola]
MNTPSALSIPSKLPNVGTTIFTVMSKLAADVGALNLSQGFPSFDCSPELVELVNSYMKKGFNQYAPMSGVPALRESLAQKTFDHYGVAYHPEQEVTIVSGATEAIYAAVTAVVRPGDEVLVFEPAYDSYVPAIELSGGVPVYITLTPANAYQIDWEEVRQKVTDRTRLIMINTPHNPIGKVLTREDLDQLAALVRGTDILLVSDEVYEHIVFDGQRHQSLLSHPVLQERTFICGSFGKTYHVTGWKIGYCLAPAALSAEFRKVHQFVTFSTMTPMQYALADFIKIPEHYLELSDFYQRKRDLFLEAIKDSRFRFTPSQGTFFQTVYYGDMTQEHDYDLAVRWTKEIGVASIPVSVFYNQKNDYKIIRFCFAKDDETLKRAGELLSRL